MAFRRSLRGKSLFGVGKRQKGGILLEGLAAWLAFSSRGISKRAVTGGRGFLE